MKKSLVTAIVILLALVLGFAVYRFAFRKSIPDAPVSQQVAAILEQNGCYSCHSGQDGTPFYAKLPFADPILAHVEIGTRFWDLRREDLENPSEVLLSKLQHSVTSGNMPLVEYKLIHWGTGFNKAEKSLLTEWILSQRQERFATGSACEAYAQHALQPIPDSLATDIRKVTLGRKMYNEARVSLDGTLSCATCHVIDKGGADSRGTRTSEGIYGQFGGINAPTVLNAAFNVEQFWNGRAHTLADQAAGPPVNPVEMGDQTWEQICERLKEDASLVAEFQSIYPEGITQATVTDAIAEYEKTLITPNDRLDQMLKGDENALTEEEKKGLAAFMDNSCAVCHVGKTLGGQSFETLGIYEDYYAAREQSNPDIVYNDDDKGLAGFTGDTADLHRFKVPGLRNISKTSPYFHDGTQATIEDAVRAMFRFELGVKEAPESDVASISAFLRTLDGEIKK
ncbi:MAG: heme-binding domain-containing protein [Paraprevotella sp.]|nr:heme-binding domain-containing protein [Paraprevotella sp.]